MKHTIPLIIAAALAFLFHRAPVWAILTIAVFIPTLIHRRES